MRRLRASPIPQGSTTVAGQSDGGISSGGTMLSTRPFAWMARSAATRVAGLPQPLTTVMPSLASASPASPASSWAREPGSALPSTHTWGLRWRSIMGGVSAQPVARVHCPAPCLYTSRPDTRRRLACGLARMVSAHGPPGEAGHSMGHRPLRGKARHHDRHSCVNTAGPTRGRCRSGTDPSRALVPRLVGTIASPHWRGPSSPDPGTRLIPSAMSCQGSCRPHRARSRV